MPEGDTVHRLAARLGPLQGRRITGAQIMVPEHAAEDLSGRVIDEVWAWGKNLLWRLTGDD
ncbi:MAG: DNA-formamidopyrimidine glycosylase family protein [Arachnia sp.]